MSLRRSSPTFFIVVVYLLAGFTWILLSDRAVELLIQDAGHRLVWQNLKGIAFIVATAALLFVALSFHERRRAATEARLRLFIEHTPAALAMFDQDMRFLEVSDRWLRDFHLRADEVIGRRYEAVLPEAPQHWRDMHERALQGEVLGSEAEAFVHADGRVQWQRWEVRPWMLDEGPIGGIVIFSEDITGHREAEQELRIAAKAFDTRQPMMITDGNQRILRVNQAFSGITGYEAEEVIGETPVILQSGRHDAAFYHALWSALSARGEWQGEIWNKRKNGEIYPERMHISAVVGESGVPSHYIASFEDISQRKADEAEIHQLSYYDGLTKLPNRRLFYDRLELALRTSARSGLRGGIFFMDLDGFSAVNDTRSHDVGDQVLITVSRQLVSAVDGDDTVARLGSDEFVVIVDDLASDEDAALLTAREIGDRLLASVRQPIDTTDETLVVTASMGISLFDGAQDKVVELVKRADAAMVQVKQIGRDCLHFFDRDMQALLEERVALEGLLRGALPEQLRLFYQPQVDVRGALIGVEALLRWEHPERGVLSPATFVPLAEESGLIVPIGKWVLESACSLLARLQRTAGFAEVSVSVNVSPKQFQQADFVDVVLAAVRTANADAGGLVLEITESILFEDVERVTQIMSALKDEGIRFSLDDFGTGFSSLSYLKSLPVDELKIDQSFVRGLNDRGENSAIVETITTLGRALGKLVIAEGVETAEIAGQLERLGCKRYQGYYFGRPMPEDQLVLRYAPKSTRTA